MKNQKGITLIALVITIIILMILAGISISLLMGEDGLITKAKQGALNYQNAALEEQEMLNNFYGDFATGIASATGDSSTSTHVDNAPFVIYNSSNGSTANLRTDYRYSNLFPGYSTCSYSAPTVNSSTVKIKNNSDYFSYSQVETCVVDLTGYNWLDVSFKNQSNTGAYAFVFIYDENATPTRPGEGYKKIITVRQYGDTSDRGSEFSLDISELTGNKWIAVCVHSGYNDGIGEYTIDNISLR